MKLSRNINIILIRNNYICTSRTSLDIEDRNECTFSLYNAVKCRRAV